MLHGDYYQNIMERRHRHQGLLRAAEQERLANIARQNPKRPTAYGVLLDQVGNTLVRLGTELKARSGAITEIDSRPVSMKETARC